MCKKVIVLAALAALLGATEVSYGFARWRNNLDDQDFSNKLNWADQPSLNGGRLVIDYGPWNGTDPPIMSYTPDPCYLPNQFRMAYTSDSGVDTAVDCEWYITGGSLTVLGDARITVNNNSSSYIEMTGGQVWFTGTILCPENSTGTATVLIHGGTMRGSGVQFQAGGVIDLAGEGRLVLDGNEVANVPTWEGAGYLTADGGLGQLSVTYDEVGDKTIITGSNLRAWDPKPQHNGQNICPDVVLSWIPGDNAATTNGHHVYFGTDYNDVYDADTSTPVIYKGRQDGNSYPESGSLSLELDKSYYWRVDEVNGVNVWRGTVWRFTTNDGTAFGPSPGDGAITVPIDVIVEWEPGCLAESHDVFIGTDFNDVNEATSSDHPNVEYANVGVDYFDPNASLDYFTVYYWRVDAVGLSQTWAGRVWSFRSESAIVDPNLRLWYKFDGTEGDVVQDSSGREFHSSDGTVSDRWEPNEGRFGGSLFCDDDIGLTVSPDMLDITDGITISVWLREAYWEGEDNVLFNSAIDSGDDYQLRADVVEDGGQAMWRAGNDTNDVIRWNLDGADASKLQGWHHWAFVKDDTTGEVSIYFDARQVESADTGDATLAELAGKAFKIGGLMWHSADFKGHVDDLRVYDYAMSFSEVARLFRGEEAELAWLPEPVDNALDVPRDANLAWLPGDFAAYHDVYLGTSFDDVNDATTANTAIYRGRQGAGELSYDPPELLSLDTTYYWRIDEVNEPNIWKGSIWRFRVANFLVVDDMESYSPVPGSGNEVFDTWDDGFMNYTGAQIALEYGTGAAVRGGEQSMKMQYNNGIAYYKYSEIDANTTGPRPGNLEIGKNWTALDVKALTLFFYGTADNDANEQMYVALEDSALNIHVSKYGAMGEDMNDIRQTDWHQWDIPLSDFGGAGVTLTDVNKVRIGFGDRDNPAVGGSGTVFFDDIRLYLPKCVPWIVKPEADISNNCIVDFEDVMMLAADWLEYGYGTVNATAPDADNLILRYEFEDASGSTITDSTVPAYNGTFFTDVNQVPAEISGRVEPGKYGNSFHFSVPIAAGGISIPNDVFVDHNLSQEITVSMWIKNAHPNETPDSGAFMWEFRQWDGNSTSGGDRVLAVEVSGRGDDYGFLDDGDSVWYEHEWDDHLDWQHYAFVRDADYLKIYVDGVLESVDNSSGNSMAVPGLLYLGIAADRAPGNTSGTHDGFTGNVDEFRIYSYALSYSEVVGLADQVSVYDAVDSPANLHERGEEETVNFKDFAVIADTWLEEILWPE